MSFVPDYMQGALENAQENAKTINVGAAMDAVQADIARASKTSPEATRLGGILTQGVASAGANGEFARNLDFGNILRGGMPAIGNIGSVMGNISGIGQKIADIRTPNVINPAQIIPAKIPPLGPSTFVGPPAPQAGQTAGRGQDQSPVRLVNTSNAQEVVNFPISPNIQETNTVNYTIEEPVHMPGAYKSFKNTQLRSYSVEAKFVARTTAEADGVLQNLALLRGWGRPYFGQTSKWLGAPPDVLHFYAYTSGNVAVASNIRKVPVIIESMSVTWPDAVDYVKSSTGERIPIVQTVSLTLSEVHSPYEFYQFDLDKFKKGVLEGF